MTKTYLQQLGTNLTETQVVQRSGHCYTSAAVAMQLAGRPDMSFVDFDGKPWLEVFGGGLVAVDMPLPALPARVQRMWLPILDQDNRAVPIDEITLATGNNQRQRCLVKAVATVCGTAMSLYLGVKGDGEAAKALLGVTEDSDLATVQPLIAELKGNNVPYVEWGVGLAVARITDPTFHWDVLMTDGLPFRVVNNQVLVDVTTTYRNRSMTLSLPIMDAAFNPMALEQVSVADWNKTVMRVLTKCIAFNSGYGLNIYHSHDFGPDADESRVKSSRGGRTRGASETTTTAKSTEARTSSTMPPLEDPYKNADADAKAKADADAKAKADADAKAKADADAKAKADAAAKAKADADAKAKADADAKAKADAAAKAKAATPPSSNHPAFDRFKRVRDQRLAKMGVTGLIGLFDALAISKVYTTDEKPACFNDLVVDCVNRVDAEHLTDLLTALGTYDAMRHVAPSRLQAVQRRLVMNVLNAAKAISSDEVIKAVERLMAAKVAVDALEVLEIAEPLEQAKKLTDGIIQDLSELVEAQSA